MNKNDKIALDDISFDDMLGEGVELDPIEDDDAAEDVVEDPKPEEEEEDDLELDAASDNEEEEDDAPKDDPEDREGEDAGDSVVGQILEKLGYDNEEGYEDTAEGLTQLTQDLGAKLAEEQLGELFEKHPLVQKHLDYVLAGGDPQTFMSAYDPNMDYGKMKLDESDFRAQRSVLTDYFSAKGHDEAFINELLEDYEDSGKLFAKAERAKDALSKNQALERDRLIETQKKEQAEQAKAIEEHWDSVYKTVQDSKEFAGLTVPTREKSKFFDYISKPVNKNGNTQRDLDHRESDMEVKLAIDYLMYKGFNLSEIIDKKATTKSVRSLKDRITGNDKAVKNAKRASRRPGRNLDLDDLDLSL